MAADEIQGTEIGLDKIGLLDPDVKPVFQLYNEFDKGQRIQLRLEVFRIPDPLLFQNVHNRAFHRLHNANALLV